MTERPFAWCVLALFCENSDHHVVLCPSEYIADQVMEKFNGFLAVKYPSKWLV
jgi:hypothetical protein